jgi:malic enzyme
VAVKKCRDQVGLVAVYVAGVFLASEITQNGFGDFGVGLSGEGASQHGRRDGLIEQTQPAAHAVERRVDFAITLLQRNGLESGRNRDFASNGILQQLLVEALHCGQNGQLPFWILYHTVTPADLSLRNAVNTGLN